MLTNFHGNEFDVVEVTNELPVNRLGGVGSVIDNLMSGFNALDIKVLWYLVDPKSGFTNDELDELYTVSPVDAFTSSTINNDEIVGRTEG